MTIQETYQHYLHLAKVDDFSLREWLRFLHGFSSMSDLIQSWHQPLQHEQRFIEGLRQLEKGYPIAYLVQETTFLGLKLQVNPSVLIPRPETEELVQLTQQLIQRFSMVPNHIVDLGTGSGAIALTMKTLFPKAHVLGIDVSSDALKVASFNGQQLQLTIDWLQSSWLEGVSSPQYPKIDVLIANPPYIEDVTTIDSNVLQYEPNSALIAQPGTRHYETILHQAQHQMNRPSLVTFEIAPELETRLRAILIKTNWIHSFDCVKDVNNKIRMLWILVK